MPRAKARRRWRAEKEEVVEVVEGVVERYGGLDDSFPSSSSPSMPLMPPPPPKALSGLRRASCAGAAVVISGSMLESAVVKGALPLFLAAREMIGRERNEWK